MCLNMGKSKIMVFRNGGPVKTAQNVRMCRRQAPTYINGISHTDNSQYNIAITEQTITMVYLHDTF